MSGSSVWDFPEADLGTSVPERFRKVLDMLPQGQPAYIGQDGGFSYQELRAASLRLSAIVIGRLGCAHTVEEQKAVALLLPPLSAHSLIGILGILETGHFYVPLDFVMGEAVLRDILRSCEPRLIVTISGLRDRLEFLLDAPEHPPVLELDALPSSSYTTTPDFLCGYSLGTQMLASIQYTSGTTGIPKGVLRTHASNVLASYLSCHDLAYRPGSRVAHTRSYAYGASQQPVFGGLLNGCTLYSLPAASSELPPSALHRWIAENNITHAYLTVGQLRCLADLAGSWPSLPSLRVIATGGEPLYRQDIERLRRLVSAECRFIARLVSTETGIYARFVIDPESSWDGSLVPGGFPAPGCQVMILDEDGLPVAEGETGQIAVRSSFLAAGYWRQPEETAARFLPDPAGGRERIFLTGDLGRRLEDGCLVMEGRKGDMVKIRGYRIEIPAIEDALHSVPGVGDCAVVATPERNGERRLLAYLVPSVKPALSVRDLRDALAQTLPPYMIPSRFIFVDRLARTENSKIDRHALPEPGRTRPELGTPFVAPRTSLERQISDIWAQLLELDEIGVNDNFFDIGGDSLIAMRMLVLVDQYVGQAAVSAFFRQPTVATLAGWNTSMTGETPQTDTESHRKTLVRRSWNAQEDSRLRHFMVMGPVRNGRPFLPYGAGICLQQALIALPVVQRLFARELDALHRWQAELGVPQDERTRRINLLANTWGGWRRVVLMRPAAQARGLVVSGDGWIGFGHDWPPGAVVLVLPHVSALSQPLERMIRSQGRETARVVDDWRIRRSDDSANWEMQQMQSRTAQLWKARHVLQRGGVVLIVSDGQRGAQTVDVPFQGRHLPFRIGAATLAVEMDALFVPVFASFDTDGRVHLDVLEPLTSQAETREKRIRELTMQYGLLYAARWPHFYASMQWRFLIDNLELPVL